MRPEALRYGGASRADGEQRLGGEVIDTEFLGNEMIVHLATDAVAADGSPGADLQARLSSEVAVTPGAHLALAVDLPKVLLFDPADGVAIGP